MKMKMFKYDGPLEYKTYINLSKVCRSAMKPLVFALQKMMRCASCGCEAFVTSEGAGDGMAEWFVICDGSRYPNGDEDSPTSAYKDWTPCDHEDCCVLTPIHEDGERECTMKWNAMQIAILEKGIYDACGPSVNREGARL